MKFLPYFIGFLILACCTNQSTQATSEEKQNDSGVVVNETPLINEDPLIEDDPEPEEIDISNPDSLFEAMKQRIDEQSASTPVNYYTIYSSYNGYESGSDATWYFDSLLQLKRCEISWSSEGTGGGYSFYFENENTMFGTETTAYQEYDETVWIHPDFDPVFGFSTSSETDNDSVNELYRKDYDSKILGVQEDLQRLLSRIRENKDSVSNEGSSMKIHLESKDNYGMEVTITEDFSIDKFLFENLIENY